MQEPGVHRCGSCGMLPVEHDLEHARLCIKTLAEREPPYCRLTGPADPEAFNKATNKPTK